MYKSLKLTINIIRSKFLSFLLSSCFCSGTVKICHKDSFMNVTFFASSCEIKAVVNVEGWGILSFSG